ncbi:MAG: hypothetical protein K2Q01_05915 [Rickettsiales bacterium]|nr:hypothetical protein [Rickettsiales bacterium]
MSKDKKTDEAARAAALEAQFRAEAEREAKVAAAASKAYADVIERVTQEVARYKSDPVVKRVIDSMAKEAGNTTIERIKINMLDKLRGEEPYASDALAAAALKGVAENKGTRPDGNQDIEALMTLLKTRSNKYNFTSLEAEIEKLGEQLKPGPFRPTKPGGVVKPKAAPASDVAVPSSEWVDVTSAHAVTGSVPKAPAPTPVSPDTTAISPDFWATASSDPATVQKDATKLLADVKKIQAVVKAATNKKVYEKYKSLGTEPNQAFLKQLGKVAADVEEGIGSRGAIKVTDANVNDWQDLLTNENKKLNDALVDSPAGAFAIKKGSTRSKVASEVLKAIVDGSKLSPKIDLNTLDDVIASPTLMERHGKTIIGAGVGAAAATAALAVSLAGGGSREKPVGPVARNEPTTSLVIKEEPKTKAPPTPEEKKAPEKAPEPKKEPEREVLPPPRLVEEKPPAKEPGKELPAPGEKESPIGMKEPELRALFEKKYADVAVYASPKLVDRGYFVKDKDNHFKVAEGYKVSYLPGTDVSNGVYAITNGRSTLLMPPGNTEMDLGLVQNISREKRYLETFKVAAIVDGKSQPLKNQLGEEANFPMPELVKNQAKFMTVESLKKKGVASIDLAGYWGDKKDVPTGRPDASKLPMFTPLMQPSARSFQLHANGYLNQNNLRANELTSEQSKYIGGLGAKNDIHVVIRTSVPGSMQLKPETSFTGFDVVRGPIVANNLRDSYTIGTADHVPMAGVAPTTDPLASLAQAHSRALGHATLWTHLADEDARVTVEYMDGLKRGNGKPEFLFAGKAANNTHDGRAKAYIDKMKVLITDSNRTYTLAELAVDQVDALRLSSTAKRASNELPNAHGLDLAQGAFGSTKSLLAGQDAVRLSSGIGADFNPGVKNGVTTLSVLLSENQARLGRHPEFAAKTQAKALEMWKDIQAKVKDNPAPAKGAKEEDVKAFNDKMTLIVEKERDLSKVLSVPYPANVVVEGKDADQLKAAELSFSAARQKSLGTMRELMGKKTPEDMINAWNAIIGYPQERRFTDPAFNRSLPTDDGNVMMLEPKGDTRLAGNIPSLLPEGAEKMTVRFAMPRGNDRLAEFAMPRGKDRLAEMPRGKRTQALEQIHTLLHDPAIRLDAYEQQTVLEMFAVGSEGAETALKGDAKKAASDLLFKLGHALGKQDLAKAIGPLHGPHDDENNIMLQLVKAVREASKESASAGLTRTDIADLRKPDFGTERGVV